MHVHISLEPLVCNSWLPLSVAPLLCSGHAYLSPASHLHLSISPLTRSLLLHRTSSRLRMSFASLIAPLTCTSDLHLLQHLSIAYLSCTYHVRHAGSHLGYKCQLHFSVSSLIWTPLFLLLIARLGCTSYLHVLCTSAPLMCIV